MARTRRQFSVLNSDGRPPRILPSVRDQALVDQPLGERVGDDRVAVSGEMAVIEVELAVRPMPVGPQRRHQIEARQIERSADPEKAVLGSEVVDRPLDLEVDREQERRDPLQLDLRD